MSVHALLYRSRATRPMEARDLLPILMASLRNNARRGVTGLLVYSERHPERAEPGAFIQWLEGPELTVRALYERIAEDPRHAECEVVAEGAVEDLTPASTRLFPHWSMALETPRVLPATLDGFLRYVREAELSELPAPPADPNGEPTAQAPPGP